jgi:DNA-binding FrmR family transcriptional regulator
MSKTIPGKQAETDGTPWSCSAPTDGKTAETLRRLRRIEGQVRGIQRMLEEGRECNDVLTQLMAIRSGVDEVSVQIIDLHIEQCLFEGIDIDPAKRAELNKSIRMMTRFHTPG